MGRFTKSRRAWSITALARSIFCGSQVPQRQKKSSILKLGSHNWVANFAERLTIMVKVYLNMKANVVLLSGAQGSGKSTIAKELVKAAYSRGLEPILMKYADILYEIHDSVWEIMKSHGVEKSRILPKNQAIDGLLLQVLGTEWGRSRDPNLWVNVMRERIKKVGRDKLVIIDDARFVNELYVTTPAFSVKVRLECGEEERKSRAEKWRERTTHESETALDNSLDRFDLLFDTSSTGDSIESIVAAILKKVL